jgi:hypothetical protein
LGKKEFMALSKSDQKDWLLGGTELITKFNQWMDDNGESQPKRGVLSTRLENLGYKKVKSHGNFVFQGLKFIDDENDSDEE